MSAFELRPRSPTEIIDAAFVILRRHYVTMITMTAVLQLPFVFLNLVFNGGLSGGPVVSTAAGIGSLLAALFGMVSMQLSDGAIIHAVSDVYLGREMSAGRSLTHVWHRLWPLIISSIIRGIASFLAALLLFIPGIYVWSRYATVGAVAVLENKGGNDTADRAWKLSEGRAWHCFVALFIAFVIYSALTGLVYYAGYLAGIVTLNAQQSPLFLIMQQLPPVLFYPIVSVVTTLIYYDLRVRKEAFDLEMMASELGAAPTPTSP